MIFIILIGLSMGSFAGVLQYRIAKNESFVKPGSYCDNCKKPLTFLQLIPILGFIFYRGKCPRCGQRVPLFYPLLEIFFTFISVIYFLKLPPQLFIYHLSFLYLALFIAVVDLKTKMVPLSIIIFGLILGIVEKTIITQPTLLESLIAAIAGFSFFYLLYKFIPGSVGLGDAYFSALAGFFLGAKGIFITIMSGFILGGLITTVLLTLKTVNRKTKIPMVPFLTAGVILYQLWGKEIINFYLK